MDSNEIKFEVIKQSLNRIISNTLWLGSIDIILLLGQFKESDNLTLGQFVMPIKYIAVSVILVLCYFTISMIQKYDRILTIYNSVEKVDKREKIKEYLNLYPSLLNPFAQHNESKFSIVYDNLGMGIQNATYAIGFSLSGLYIIPNNRLLIMVFTVILIVLFMLRQDYLRIEKRIDSIIDKQNRANKKIFSWILLITYFIIWLAATIKLK